MASLEQAVLRDREPMSQRHCEPTGRREAPPDDRLREPIASFFARRNGLLRCARNDGFGCLKIDSQPLSPGLTGRSSIPETSAIEPKDHGVLDCPVKPGNDSGMWAALCADPLARNDGARHTARRPVKAAGPALVDIRNVIL